VTKSTVTRILIGATAVAAAVVGSSIGEAHKAITSKYSYNEDVFPILKAKCASCHVDGGVAPMSLMTYNDAFPWGESIRAELIAAHMPPWNAEGGYGHLQHAQLLTPKEIDVILTWATGGNPEGDRAKAPAPVKLNNDWALGQPDLALKFPDTVNVPADQQEMTHAVTLAVKNPQPRWVRAIDLLPGNPVMVRSATIALKGADGKPGDVITTWIPGGTLVPADGPAAFQLPANAELVATVHYKKTWQYDSQALTDQSTVGVYYAKDGAHQRLEPMTIASAPLDGTADVKFSKTLDRDIQAFALTPGHVPPHGGVQVEAALPDGSHVPMIRLNTRPDWDRRYWFEKPLVLPKGSQIAVTASIETPFTLPMPDLLAPPEQPMSKDPLTITIDYTASAGAQPSGH
jgi:hypothetical protein